MQFNLSDIYKSLVRHLNDTLDDAKEKVSTEVAYYAFDSRGDISEMEVRDLVGLGGWTFKEDNGLWIVHVGITVSTLNDEHLFREMDIVDTIHDFWGEGKTVRLLNTLGDEVGQLVVSDFEMMAAGTSEKRNFRPIGIELLRTGNNG